MNNVIPVVIMISLFASCGAEPDKSKAKVTSMNSPADSVSAEPYLFTDKNGQVYLSFVTKELQQHTLNYSVLKEEKWSKPSVIATGNNWFVNWADYPMLASNGNNNLIAHYLEKSDKGTFTYDIKYLTSADQGQHWSQPVTLHDDGKKAEHGFVSIVPFGEQYFVSWLDGRNAVAAHGEGHEEHQGQMTIRGAILDTSGKKINEWELDNRVCDCCQTSAAITSNGPIVVYRDRSENEIRDISIVRLVNGQWTVPKTIAADNWEIKGCPVNGPSIAASGNNLAIAWFTSSNNTPQVQVIFSEDGGATFSKPVKVDEGNAIGRVDIVLLEDKTAMVSWMEGQVIKAVKVSSAGKKDASVIVASSSGSRSSGFPQMALSGNKVIFAWTDDAEKKIKTARLMVNDVK